MVVRVVPGFGYKDSVGVSDLNHLASTPRVTSSSGLHPNTHSLIQLSQTSSPFATMKVFALLAFALPAVLGSPAGAGTIVQRDPDTSCNPYTDWGHTQGAHSYYCGTFGDYPNYEFHCVRYKSADYCNGKAYCSDKQPCGGNAICSYGVCVEKVNGKHCKRTCDPY
ncbi:hypothetical protein N657DRAFT_247631 [Parathielavia appendiculata]|uniref:Uncharacterized protein n=1 Tax=Parathielavia appendiculata TaxID=2587402 RepID=A0AAN6TS34_9PEZI|nr:hypothetical protein N657DRAFT_247631 [Parathielavia appendiculata]